MKSKNIWIVIAGVLGFLGIALGAFGAHGLRDKLSPETIEIYKTGVLYQLIHSVVLLVLALTDYVKSKLPFIFFAIGIVLFSFSLYLYSITGASFFAVIAPLGGISFLIGWLLIIISVVIKKT